MGVTEAEIRALAKAAVHDSDAFERLFQQYQPLLLHMFERYHLIGFDRDDWLQEARTAMLRAIINFNGDAGSKFGSYFRLVARSQLNGLIRVNLSLKRAIDQNATLMSKIPDHYVHEPTRNYEDSLLMGIELSEFLDTLSEIETQSFFAELNGTMPQQPPSVRRARERTRRKLENYIADYHH
ncbi:sigma-70 family RNA polymerase sigma factor [Lacticaseibacillus porcinae]|uniref:sigma-70 family RNA polymerase sigma factor n=1 Tax=Lacticaseibacillus porcinae TaxID=1123687 RepID=UPI000F78F59F|nr:sigma-70 family RNA polymerase sigma factor [Lacticaseibacillus porcinae]